jgi:hypothetical protein
MVTYATHFPGPTGDEVRAEIEKAIAAPKPKRSTDSELEHPADQSAHPKKSTGH